MTTTPSLSGELRILYGEESARIQREFEAQGDGRQAVVQRTLLLEQVARRLWQENIAKDETGPSKSTLVAIGGFGRGFLFPYSDVDLLFLHENQATEEAFKDPIRRFSQELWDLRVKVSPFTRTLAECDRFDPDNVEFTLSLLDCRFLDGNPELFSRLHDKVIPKLIMRDSQTLVQRLAEITRDRHAKYGETVFHLEPNIKEVPGGLRDYNVACWLALISAMDKLHEWPDAKSLLPASARRQLEPALEFLTSVRCFLHFRHGRDDNGLSWADQDEAAARKIGAAEALDPAEWMRIYFGHARAIHRVTMQLLEEIPAAWSSLYRQFQGWRARVSNADFSVVDGLIFLRQPAAIQDPEVLLRMFDFMAQHGLKLSTTTEYRIEQVLPSLSVTPPKGAELWQSLQVILLEPYAADALRAMHSLRLLHLLLPEMKVIDSLVVRDFYHRYTVDEHSFRAIESLHRLSQSKSEWDQRYSEVFNELERPELLFLALLLHDTGKGVAGGSHVENSLEIAAQCLGRLDLDPADRELVLFLIENHLEISAVMRRDIFDPQTVRSFAEKMGTPERLKMLCLMTYADIKSVNPEALTPWKAENIWQIYIAAVNDLNRSADELVHTDADDESLDNLHSLAPVAGKRIKAFLEGFPKRYLRSYPPDEVLRHFDMAQRLEKVPVQSTLKRGRHWYEVTVITGDRPFLFATIAGVLTAWGMNIVKANAFSDQAGVVVDTFYFTDRFRTLELNLPEWERFQRSLAEVLTGTADLERMLQNRLRSEKNGVAKVKVETRIEFDDQSATHSTLLQVIAQDRPGLLHRITSQLSHQNCNIDIALIDTEGQMAIDVFYLTSNRAKLDGAHQNRLKAALLDELKID
ncbi:MAG: [protein-PII] uridylyltransferase [Terriglobales bacterium]